MSFDTTLTDAQRDALTAYAKVRYDLIENLGCKQLNQAELKRISYKLTTLGITLSWNDSIVGVRANTERASAMFEWNNWKQELHFFRERGE